jgi:ADA HAT complex component 1
LQLLGNTSRLVEACLINMQSIFRLPWCSDPIVRKLSDSAAVDKMRPSPTVEIPVLNNLKRKYTDSLDAVPLLQPQESKKPRSEEAASPVPASAFTRTPVKSGVEQTITQAAGHLEPSSAVPPSQTRTSSIPNPYFMENLGKDEQQSMEMESPQDIPMQHAPLAASEDALGFTPLQQTIENSFNMQILMKHNELRLIEQELAKCQIALEQLRRCELRPYPGSDGLSQNVSAGTGPTIAPPPGFNRPAHPAPHGVTDGPYSRHYRQWLLRDPEFDATPIHSSFYVDPSGRSTRNSGSVRQHTSKRFALDGLQSIPNYPAAPPKDKSAPLVLRRSTDNQLVKLICSNCAIPRGNFSSIQGFLNHCRIAHKVDYKSHDAAAIDSGVLLDENEVANLPTETQNTPAPKPSVSRAPTANSTPLRSNLIHPYNTVTGDSIALGNPKKAKVKRKAVPKLSKVSPAPTRSPFTPSAQVPRLSAQFAKHAVGGDLQAAVLSAKEKVDLSFEEDVLYPDVSEINSPLEHTSLSRKGNAPGRAGMTVPSSGGRPPSQKGFRQPTQQRPRPSPLGPPMSGLNLESGEIPESPFDPTHDLSPHTADSNPGLVSDHEDDDHGSASEEEAPQAEMRRPINVPATCADTMEIDVAVDDDMVEDGLIIRRGSMFAEEQRGLHGSGSPSRKLGMGKRG